MSNGVMRQEWLGMSWGHQYLNKQVWEKSLSGGLSPILQSKFSPDNPNPALTVSPRRISTVKSTQVLGVVVYLPTVFTWNGPVFCTICNPIWSKESKSQSCVFYPRWTNWDIKQIWRIFKYNPGRKATQLLLPKPGEKKLADKLKNKLQIVWMHKIIGLSVSQC